MRIRKHASKLLGVVAPASPCFPPPPQHASMWAAAPSCSVDASAGFWQLCRLNCSPWDVMPVTSLPPIYSDEDQFVELKEEQTSVMEHRINEEDDEFHTSSSITKNEKNKSIDISEDSEEEETAINGAPKLCKKSDGKKWKCKRLATNHHSFCDHHINQMRSYSNTSNRIIKKKKKKKKALESTRSRNGYENATEIRDSSNFYYYAGFGPSSGKRRGGGTREDSEEDNNGVKEEISCFEELEDKLRRKRVKARSLKSFL